MSVSATTAAKKRRANNGSNPMFKSPSSEMPLQQENVSMASSSSENSGTNNIQRPMTLQQVITVFDNRLLNLEKSLLNNETTSNEPVATTTTTAVKSDIDREYIEKMHQDFQDSLNEQFSEFDHRYQLLAKEVIDLKHIVLKLQSYTLDVNKALIEERVQILTTDDDNEPLRIQPDDILDLHSDLESMQKSINLDENTSPTHNMENVSLSDKEEDDEKLSNDNENIQKEIVESGPTTVVEEHNKNDLAENIVSITE